jgi:hypothetical protein
MVTQQRPNTDSPVNLRSEKSLSEKSLMEAILGPLEAVYRRVCAPPWTDQERRRRARIDASIRSSVSVNPYHLTHRW